jgi:hypothetical protein
MNHKEKRSSRSHRESPNVSGGTGPLQVQEPGWAFAAIGSASLRQRRCLSSFRWRARRPRRRAYAPGAMRRAGVALPFVVLSARVDAGSRRSLPKRSSSAASNAGGCASVSSRGVGITVPSSPGMRSSAAGLTSDVSVISRSRGLDSAAVAVRAEVDQEGQDDEEPLEAGDVAAGSPSLRRRRGRVSLTAAGRSRVAG